MAAAIALSGAACGVAATPAAAETMWVCKPGQAANPCRESFKTTVYASNGSSRVVDPPIPANPPVDCFYVYPTVSNQPGPNASMSIDPEIEAIVRYQAARLSQQCNVYAPVYRQTTVPALLTQTATPEARQRAYGDVLDAWRDYMKNHNHGRGVVLIGHSQGANLLRRLVRTEIDPRPALRKQLVSAVLLGGNVLVKRGKHVGGDFQHVPACTAPTEAGCVIAYSTFNEPPPANSRYGRPPAAPDPVTGAPGGPGLEVVCNNPASLGANRAGARARPSSPARRSRRASSPWGSRSSTAAPSPPRPPRGSRPRTTTPGAARSRTARTC